MMPSLALSVFLAGLTPPAPPSIYPLDKKTHLIATTTNDNDSLVFLADHLGSPQILHILLLTSDIAASITGSSRGLLARSVPSYCIDGFRASLPACRSLTQPDRRSSLQNPFSFPSNNGLYEMSHRGTVAREAGRQRRVAGRACVFFSHARREMSSAPDRSRTREGHVLLACPLARFLSFTHPHLYLHPVGERLSRPSRGSQGRSAPCSRTSSTNPRRPS